MNSTMKVSRVVDDGDRTLLYPEKRDSNPFFDYHVIVPKGTEIKPGDTVEYEPYGFNFGRFVRKV